MALYRNWSRSLIKKDGKRWVSDSSINLRLSALKRFYNYCYKNGLIDFEPWETLYKIKPEAMPSFLRHTHGQKQIKSNDLVLKTFKKLPKLLSLEQCRELIFSIESKTFKLITKLILSTGLRKDEVISFVFNHIYEPDLHRLYSFYYLLKNERSFIGIQRWKNFYSWVIKVIDNEITPKFDEVVISIAMKSAIQSPHPMWLTRSSLVAI